MHLRVSYLRYVFQQQFTRKLVIPPMLVCPYTTLNPGQNRLTKSDIPSSHQQPIPRRVFVLDVGNGFKLMNNVSTTRNYGSKRQIHKDKKKGKRPVDDYMDSVSDSDNQSDSDEDTTDDDEEDVLQSFGYDLLKSPAANAIEGRTPKQMEIVLKSLRIDNVASKVFGMSRSDVGLDFHNGRLFFNGQIILYKGRQLKQGDFIDLCHTNEDGQVMARRVHLERSMSLRVKGDQKSERYRVGLLVWKKPFPYENVKKEDN